MPASAASYLAASASVAHFAAAAPAAHVLVSRAPVLVLSPVAFADALPQLAAA